MCRLNMSWYVIEGKWVGYKTPTEYIIIITDGLYSNNDKML